jgi:ABC-type cobalamin/Fe3+-siderophores transport system ATPase subunit
MKTHGEAHANVTSVANAIHEVHLTVKAGVFAALFLELFVELLGPRGAGQSTLLKCLSQLAR